MNLRHTPEDETFRAAAAAWLTEQLSGEFAALRDRGGPGDESALIDERRRWESQLGKGGWAGMGWPIEYGGRNASLAQQTIFREEYARARAPGRLGHIGEELLGPTLIAFGTDSLKRRFLPPILAGTELWCQGYSEPNAGSDLANVQTRATLEPNGWVITGQKVWTSLAHCANWCFLLCRTKTGSKRHDGISCLLVPMKQPGVTVRPIVQMTGAAAFSEVFFDGARAAPDHVVGHVDEGWRIAMATLTIERGVSTLGQQLAFENELDAITETSRRNGASKDPLIAQRLAKAWMGLRIMRLNALRAMSSGMHAKSTNADFGRVEGGAVAAIGKLYWATWHRDLGELAIDVAGPLAQVTAGALSDLTPFQRLFLFSRADTIYAGSNEIQRNIIAERTLGLPPEPRGRS